MPPQVLEAHRPGRMVSSVSPEARHVHKTVHRMRDGFKGHVALEPAIGLDAITLIHTTGRGLPRANNLAVQALLDVLIQNKTIVDEASARAAVAELTTE